MFDFMIWDNMDFKTDIYTGIYYMPKDLQQNTSTALHWFY